jgi:tetratricopeptide (TPR) repeat protein
MDTFKTIFSGRMEFGSARSFEKTRDLFYHRVENYYRNDVLLKEEEMFDEDSLSFNVPRSICQATKKSWLNTQKILEYVAQFSVAGNMQGWMTESGKMLETFTIEPDSDKAAVQAFLRGRELVKTEGKEDEAKIALNRAIEKFERHALAYERRGRVNFQLKNMDDALYDYTKSISINPNNPDPYYGRAYVHIIQGNYQKAIEDLELTTKKSIPHQPIYWKARRTKGDCHLKLKEFEEAAFEYKMFIKRAFTPENPNFMFRRKAYSNYGIALTEMGEFALAVDAFNAGLEIEENGANKETNPKKQAEQYLYRGIAKQKAGETGFANDWEQAADLGSKRAEELLAAI